MKTLREFLTEARQHDELKHRILDHMDKRYQEVAPDLPRHGDYHYAAAHDHLRDHAYDTFRSHPDFSRKHHNLSSLATRALRPYGVNDTSESRRNEARRDKQHAKQWARNDQPARPAKKAAAKSRSWWAEMGYAKKPKKGIGSY